MKYEVISDNDFYRDKEGDWCFPSGQKVIFSMYRRSANQWIKRLDARENKVSNRNTSVKHHLYK